MSKMKVVGYLLTCCRCNIDFIICACCYRGHIYCSESCSTEARAESRKKANEQYAQSQLGKRNQYKRNKKYLDKRELPDDIEKNVTDQSSQNQESLVDVSAEVKTRDNSLILGITSNFALVCNWCGGEVDFLDTYKDDQCKIGIFTGGIDDFP